MTRALLVCCLVLGAMLAGAGARIMSLERALAAKPKVEIREVVKTVTKRGPVQVVERIVVAPDGTKTTERTTNRGEVVAEKDKESERTETPVQAPRYDRFIGVLLDPLSVTKANGLRGGMTVFGRIDAAASVRVSNTGVPALGGDLSWRF